MLGSKIAHYEVLEKIGEGGMGAVYRARDTHLDRSVAIKVLPPGKTDDAERRRRFVQEAKAASALNHPNIITVYDAANEGGVDYIAMEYVAGKTLDELIRRKPLRPNEALGYAIQIADALARAHSAGIVHRDLKPSNIMVDNHGLVKVLDFGLAKLTETEATADGATATLQAHTDRGIVVGTAAYMSPEQAEGRPVDSRTDVFSFGLVVYEMLSGANPFRRESRISTLAAVVNENPKPLAELSPSMPPELDRTVTRCLRKDPQRRWQSMSDLKSVLEDLKEESESGSGLVPARPPGGKRSAWALAAGGALVLAAIVFAFWVLTRQQAGEPQYQIARVTFDALALNPTISRDGKLMAYASDREGKPDIWVRYLDRPQPVRRTNDPVGASMPSLSPDGSRIVFRSERNGGGLYVMDTLGGEERPLVADNGLYPRFSPDGGWVVYTRRAATSNWPDFKMFIVPSEGGEPRPFQPAYGAVLGRGGTGPIWSPDGRFILFKGVRAGAQEFEWVVAPVEGGQATLIDRSALPQSWISYWPSSWPARNALILCQGSTIEGMGLYRLPISETFQIAGPPEVLASGPGLRFETSSAAEGTVLFSIVNWSTRIGSVALDATGCATGDPQILALDSATKLNASASRDGTRIAWYAIAGFATGLRTEVRVRDLRSGRETLVGHSNTLYDKRPRLSPDGSLVAYRDSSDGVRTDMISPSEGGPARRICQRCTIVDFFPGNQTALVAYGERRLVRQNISDGTQVPLIEIKDGAILDPRVSDDGRHIVFSVSRPDGGAAIRIAPVRNGPAPESEWIPVAESGSAALAEPNWGPGGNTVYYASEQDGYFCIWARRLDPATARPVGEPFAAVHFHNVRRGLAGRRDSSGISIAGGRIYFILADTESNVWRLTLPPK